MVFVFLFVLIFLPNIVMAKEQPLVVINEIAWMGSFVNGVNANQHWRYEWLELYGEETVNLDGWSIELYKGEELYFEILLSGSINANEYFLVASSSKILEADINYANLSGKFLNDGMRVVLNNSEEKIVDEVDVTNAWPAGDKESKQTMERIKISDASVGWQTSVEPGGTPKNQNSSGFQEKTPLETAGDTIRPVSNGASKKDHTRPLFTKFSELSFTPFLLAFPLSLGFGFLILALRRVLSRQS